VSIVRQAVRSNLYGLKWLVLAVLAWAQINIAAHSFEHHADDLHATCAICVQLDRDDAPPALSAALSPVSPTAASVLFDADSTESTLGFSLYSARASP